MTDLAHAPPRLGGSPEQRQAFMAYTRAFSAADFDRFSAYYTDDVVCELKDLRLEGRSGIVNFYRAMFAAVRESLTLHHLVADDTGIAADITSQFTAIADAPRFTVAPLAKGEFVRVRVFVYYRLRDGKISHIRVARAGEVSAPRRAEEMGESTRMREAGDARHTGEIGAALRRAREGSGPLKFTYQAMPARVVFRAGALEELPQELARIGSRALVLCTPEQRPLGERAAALLGERAAGIFAHARMHVPIETARAAGSEVRRLPADCCVAIGGGSTTGLAKAVALELGLPILAVPTTYAGSEATPIWGITEAGVKRTGRDARVLPRTVLYDPLLTLSLSPALSGVSGLNAIAHCVEGLYSEAANPVASLMAEEGIRALSASLPRVIRDPAGTDGRAEALYGAWLGGMVLGAVGMALHHKLCHVLGGTFDLPHAETHAIVLPHAVAYNATAAPEAMRRIAAALGTADPAQGLFELGRSVGAPAALKDIGMNAEGIERAVELAVASPYYNPAPIQADGLRRLLWNAFEGRRPEP
jgi:maleylacetate reductase